MKHLMILTIVLMLTGCNRAIKDQIQSTPAGLFYTSWTGSLFQIVDGKLVPIRQAPHLNEGPRSITFSTTIPNATDSGFPVSVTGTLKLENGVRQYKVDLDLGPNGKKQPTSADRVAFVGSIRQGTARLKSLSLTFLDKDGFLSSDNKDIPIPGDGWSYETDTAGSALAYEYLSREQVDPTQNATTASVDVKWIVSDASSQTPVANPSPAPPPAPNPFLDLTPQSDAPAAQ